MRPGARPVNSFKSMSNDQCSGEVGRITELGYQARNKSPLVDWK